MNTSIEFSNKLHCIALSLFKTVFNNGTVAGTLTMHFDSPITAAVPEAEIVTEFAKLGLPAPGE